MHYLVFRWKRHNSPCDVHAFRVGFGVGGFARCLRRVVEADGQRKTDRKRFGYILTTVGQRKFYTVVETQHHQQQIVIVKETMCAVPF